MTNESGDSFVCRPDNILDRIACVLIYPSTFDIVLNYFLLILNLAYCAFQITPSAPQTTPQARKFYAAGSFIFVVFFQITLCLILGCNGISIIWCAMMGWSTSTAHQTVRERKEANPSETTLGINPLGKATTLLDFLAILYYAITAEAITTIAHVCAVILGVFLEKLARFGSSMNGTSSEQEPMIQ